MSGVQLASKNRRPFSASSKSTLPRHIRASRMCRNGTHARPLNSAFGQPKQLFRYAAVSWRRLRPSAMPLLLPTC